MTGCTERVGSDNENKGAGGIGCRCERPREFKLPGQMVNRLPVLSYTH